MSGITSGPAVLKGAEVVENPQFHPSEEYLVDYAAGGCSPTWSLVIEAHLALCPECRATVARLEALGGALLERLEETPVSGDLEERLLREMDSAEVTPFPGRVDEQAADLPSPVARLLPARLEDLHCNMPVPSGSALKLPLSDSSLDACLVRLEQGAELSPDQFQAMAGYLMVLSGCLENEASRYGPGDFAALSELEHCLSVGEGDTVFCLLVLPAVEAS